MKSFITKFFAFTLFFACISIPIDFGVSYLLRKDSQRFAGEFDVWNEIYNSKTDYDMCIYGSSRAEVGVNPQILEDNLDINAYNFGMDGHHFWLQYLRHTEYLKNNKKPKKIILSLDVFSLEKRVGLYNYSQFLPYMLWNANMREYTKSYDGFEWYDYYIPLIRYSGESKSLKSIIRTILKGNKTKLRNKGYVEMDTQWNSDFEIAKKKKKNYSVKLEEKPVNLFKKFITECRLNNIELIFIYPPEYIEGQKFVSNRTEVIEFYKEISKKNDILFYDFSNDAISFDKKYFYNASHLNKLGATLFTQKLSQKLKK